VFYKDESWYMIIGNYSGEFFGYVWNGTGWDVNLTINSSLPDVATDSSPEVFFKDESWYLISGNAGGSVPFYGFVWNGTDWKVNTTINASLPSMGTFSQPTVFYKDSSWYLVSGNTAGTFSGFTYNQATLSWVVNITINSSLPDIGAYSSPSVFFKDESWYLVSGAQTQQLFGYVFLYDTFSPTYTRNRITELRAGYNNKFSIDVNDEQLTPDGQYIFSTNNTGNWINDSVVNFTTTPSLANVTKTLNSTIGTLVGYMWYFTDNNQNTNSTPVYTLTTREITPPTITFESPTPDNGSTVNSPNQTITANISDASNTSAWLDFDRSLVGYWAMDYYNATHIFDNSTYKKNASYSGGINYSQIENGSRGMGIRFDTNDNLIIPYNTLHNLTKDLTLSIWIDTNYSTSGFPVVFGKNGVYQIGMKAASDNIRATFWNYANVKTEVDGCGLYNYMNHIVLIKSSADGRFYLYCNGALSLNYSYPNDLLATSTAGLQIFGASGVIAGLGDEAMIFNRSLSQMEVLALYNSQSNKLNATLSNLSEGNHSYVVSSIDMWGNRNSSSQGFNVTAGGGGPTAANYSKHLTFRGTSHLNLTGSSRLIMRED
ncbi:MAG: hypothetical protein AABY32_03040, partial [Nanoarchaeota archaeon]